MVLVLYSLLLIAACGGITALAWNQDRKLDLNAGDFNLQAFVASTDTARWIVTAILVVVAIIGLLTLILAVVRGGSGGAKGTLRMRQADGGTLEVTTASIENLLRGELEQLPEVRTVNPRVRLVGGAVDTSLDASIEPSASIANATSLLAQGVANVLREQVGVTNIRRPNIRIHYDEANARPVPARAPTAPTMPPPMAEQPWPMAPQQPATAPGASDWQQQRAPEATPQQAPDPQPQPDRPVANSAIQPEPPLPDSPTLILPQRPPPESWSPEDPARHE
ncbi:MAG: alkaline shock response membrane anchor protein AmaP [Tepidiformaceae bacterium]